MAENFIYLMQYKYFTTAWYAYKAQYMHIHYYTKVDSDKGGRQSKIMAN